MQLSSLFIFSASRLFPKLLLPKEIGFPRECLLAAHSFHFTNLYCLQSCEYSEWDKVVTCHVKSARLGHSILHTYYAWTNLGLVSKLLGSNNSSISQQILLLHFKLVKNAGFSEF